MSERQLWRGEEYSQHRTLIMGESAYSWYDEEGNLLHPPPDHAQRMVKGTFESPIKNRFFQTLVRGLTQKHAPRNEEVQQAWSKVAFLNYVDGTVGVGPGLRPSDAAWNDAREKFRSVLEEVRPKTIIVLGKTMWSKMPETDYYITDDVQGYRLSDRSTAMCWAVNHPRSGLSWERLAQVISFATTGKVILDVMTNRY